ncbi:MAG: hypothetical protein ACLS7Z_05840 [Christensenellales bacterium]
MNQREYRIGPGAASLMLLVVVLSMSVLGMLALMSARSDENLSLRSAEVARQVAELNVSAERSLAELDDALAKAAGAAQSEDDYLARVEAALNEAMTLEGRTVSWKETNDEGRTLACAVELRSGARSRAMSKRYTALRPTRASRTERNDCLTLRGSVTMELTKILQKCWKSADRICF